MRLRRLTVPAYGPFTGLDLEFPAFPADLHFIYGGNEAGKSSLLRAIRDLLYGIPAQTGDNFRHDYKDLRIGAEIENRAGQCLALQRRKGNRNTLLDAAGHPLEDAALAPYLGPVRRDFFTTMFGLGSEELRQGAADLLQGKGDLGQALFSASLAGTPIHRVLDKLDAEARSLFDGRARKNVSIRPALEIYEESLRASKQAQVKGETWDETLRELACAQQIRGDLDVELQFRRGRQDWLRRCLDALPTLGRLREMEARLAELPALPDMPAGLTETAAATRHALALAEHNLADLGRRGEELVQRRDLLTPRAEVLDRAAEIDTLAQNLAIHRHDREALAADQSAAEQLRAGLASGLLNLGLALDPADIDGLRVPLEQQLALRSAAAELQQVEQASAEQRREVERLIVEQEKIIAQLNRLPVSDVAALRAACAATAAAAVIADRDAGLAVLARRVDDQLLLLPGAPADPAATYVLALPSAARLRASAEAVAALDSRAQQLEETGKKAAKSLRDLKAKLARLEARGALPSPAALAAARARRESGWRLVLACWKGGAPESEWDGAPLTDSYPAAVQRADALADRLREEAEAVAQAEELRWQIHEAEAAMQACSAEQARLEADRLSWQADWTALWLASGLAPATPGEMQEWRENWGEFRNRYVAWRELRDEVRAGRECVAAAVDLLRPLLDGVEQPLPALRDLAERRLRAADQVQGERRGLEARLSELQGDIEQAARPRAALDLALAQARARWGEHPLGGDLRPDAALKLLEARIDLVARHDAWSRLTTTLVEKRRALEAYESRARTLVEAVDGIYPLGQRGTFSAEVAVNTLGEALTLARDLRARRSQVAEDLEQVMARLPQARQDAEAARNNLATLLARAGVADSAALEMLLADLATRRKLADERAGLHAALHVPARGEALEIFMARVREENAEALAAELAELDGRIGELEQRRDRATRELARAEDARTGLEASGASAAEHLQSARNAAARVGRDSARYLRLRLATQFLKAQIEAFRTRNQGPLLARAGELFREMTGASFSGLGTDYAADDMPILVGLKDGSRVPVAGMSEGSRDQLYLALRLAAIELHQARHEPMPLILDDLLITFDDDRARHLLPLLRDLAGRCQVLLFTHHRHLLDLARESPAGQGAHFHAL